MKLRTALLTLAVCGVSFSSFANVSLTLPDSADLVLVNGTKAQGNDPLSLKDGDNQIAFRYETNYRENGDTHLFKSEVVIVTFNGKDASYTLSLPKIHSQYEAKAFNKQPHVTITDQQNNDIAIKQDVLIKNGVQIGRDFQQEIAKYNLSGAPAALTSAISVSVPQVQNVAVEKSGKVDQAYVTKMLNYWYEKADKTTQDQFKASINK
ncbi:YccT family protein [Photobacterium leiognathi]|uniref:YccT family protein n=1 Tax=Photobacterium leiognathi TaxID=553611 RepID=UPI002980FD3B|nr:DUF2057 domain-containing protein [Photobacterium leiognathi]